MKKVQIFPSLMSADLLNLETVIKTFEPHCDGFHLDIMDNHFVPNITWGQDLTNQIAAICTKPLLVHLMVENPLDFVTTLKLTKNSVISFHIEAANMPETIMREIKKMGYIPSIAIKPATPIEKLEPLLRNGLPHVLLMSVEPGFSGQTFIESSIQRLQELAHLKKNHQFIICMDGGIHRTNIKELYQKGSDQFALSSAIFKAKDPLQALENLYQLCC